MTYNKEVNFKKCEWAIVAYTYTCERISSKHEFSLKPDYVFISGPNKLITFGYSNGAVIKTFDTKAKADEYAKAILSRGDNVAGWDVVPIGEGLF